MMRVKEIRLLAHDIIFKNEYLRSSKIATVQKVFVCVYIYIYFLSTYTACMYAYGPEWMTPPEEMPHSSSTTFPGVIDSALCKVFASVHGT